MGTTHYVDGFLLPLRRDRIEDYRAIAAKAGEIWRDHGALDYWECIGDDLHLPDLVSFASLAGAGPDETVVFAWIVYASKEDRDRVNALVHADPRMKDMGDPAQLPFDMKRIACGGFRALVHA